MYKFTGDMSARKRVKRGRTSSQSSVEIQVSGITICPNTNKY